MSRSQTDDKIEKNASKVVMIKTLKDIHGLIQSDAQRERRNRLLAVVVIVLVVALVSVVVYTTFADYPAKRHELTESKDTPVP